MALSRISEIRVNVDINNIDLTSFLEELKTMGVEIRILNFNPNRIFGDTTALRIEYTYPIDQLDPKNQIKQLINEKTK